MTACNYAYRIVGTTSELRRLVDATAAFAGYAACDQRAEVDREAYLSAFCYGEDFRARSDAWGVVDTKGFNGICWSPWVWWDIDRDGELESALSETRRLAETLADHHKIGDEALLIFFSGGKGFHIGLSTALWLPEPSVNFHRVTRRFAETTAEAAGVAIDTGVYDKVRAFRAPNSRHPKTGLRKRRFTLDDLNNLALVDILRAAGKPEPFDVPTPINRSDRAAADWQAANRHVERQTEAHAQRRAVFNGATQLNRQTLDFIANGAGEGDRHRLLYSAAANLAEFDCPPVLAHALLTAAALDSGLPPTEVRRQIACGLAAQNNGGASHG